MKQYGLIGYPLTHSFSEKYFTEKFKTENISNVEFKLFPIQQIGSLFQLILEQPNLCGLSVTTPYKEIVIPFLNELDETAKSINAVNCIKVNKFVGPKGVVENKLIGYNTDAFGFKQSIKPFLETHHERALIIGTGGAAKAIHFVLNQIGVDCYFVSRTKNSSSSAKHFSYEELNENVMQAFKLIVNCTPIGMYPTINESPTLPYHLISSSHLLYDLIYNPKETEFLKKGKMNGATTINGLSMLHQQAEEAWRIWNL